MGARVCCRLSVLGSLMAELYGTFLGQVLQRTARLCRRPWVLVASGLIALGGSALVLLPIFGLPGYELGAVVAIALGLVGSVVAISAARLERETILEGGTAISLGATAAALIPFGASMAVLVLAALVPWGI